MARSAQCYLCSLGVWFGSISNVADSEGSPLDRNFLIGLLCGGLVLLARRRLDWSRVMSVLGTRIPICLFCCLLVAGRAAAATRRAATCSLSDIQAQVNASRAGDTVSVPAGNASWSSALTIGNNISVIGAGSNATFVTCSGSAASITGTGGGVIRLSGFRFTGPSGSDAFWMGGAPTNSIRIDHCWVQGFRYGFNAYCIGVIDHCTFYNPRMYLGFVQCPSPGMNPQRSEQDWVRSNWYPVPLTTTNALFIEDCLVYWNAFDNNNNTGIQSYQAASYIVRHCQFIANSTGTYQQFWDYHGNQGDINSPSTPRGSVAIGVYDNTYNITGTAAIVDLIYIRGGSGLFFSNNITGAGASVAYIHMYEEDADGKWGYSGPPYYDQITNVWIWANTVNGNSVSIQCDSNGASIVGNGLYYSNSAPSPLIFTRYPHPLVATQDGGQTNAILSITFSSRDFGSVLVGSRSDLQITLKNVGGGILGGIASVPAPFSIISGSTYSLGAGQSQTVTVRYTPTAVGADNQNVTFTGGGGAIISLSARAQL